MSSRHVALVYRDATLPTGGLSIDIRNLANALVARGHRVSVIGLDHGSGTASTRLDPAAETHVLRPLAPRRIALPYGVAPGAGRLIGELRPDVVHVFSCLPVYLHFAAMAAARRNARALVWTPMIHPLRRGLWRSYGAVGRAMRVFDALAPRLGRRVDAVAAATEDEAREFRERGCPRVEVLPPAVEELPPESDEAAHALRREMGVGPGPLVIAVTGRAERRKGIDFCLRSFELLRRQMPGASLLLVGSGAVSESPPPGVHPRSDLSDAELRASYRAADAAFVPSRYEAFSRVVIEAWQQARPVVVTDGVGLAPTVRGRGGAVVGYGDAEAAAGALGSLISDREGSEAYGRRGRELVEAEFTVPVVAGRTEALYEGLLDG